MKKLIGEIRAETIKIAGASVFGVLCGILIGYSFGFPEGSQHTTEVRNVVLLDAKPYDASLEIKDLEYSSVSPSGFTVSFNTNKTTGTTIYLDDINGLECEWAVYPSGIYTTSPVGLQAFEPNALKAKIETYPEGGTVMFRIIDFEQNRGSLWFYIDLPRPKEGTVLPPPYKGE